MARKQVLALPPAGPVRLTGAGRCLCREYRGHGPQPVRLAGLAAGPRNNTQLVVSFAIVRCTFYPCSGDTTRLDWDRITLYDAPENPFVTWMTFRAFRRGDVRPGHPNPQDLRRGLPGRRVDPQPVRPRWPPVRRHRLGLGALVHNRHLLLPGVLPPSLRAAHVCGLLADVPGVPGVQCLPSLPAGDGQDHHLALDLRPLPAGRGTGVGGGRGGRGVQPLLHAPDVLPGAGLLRGVLHLLPAEHGLCHHGDRDLPVDQPERWGGDRPGSPGGEAPGGPER